MQYNFFLEKHRPPILVETDYFFMITKRIAVKRAKLQSYLILKSAMKTHVRLDSLLSGQIVSEKFVNIFNPANWSNIFEFMQNFEYSQGSPFPHPNTFYVSMHVSMGLKIGALKIK